MNLVGQLAAKVVQFGREQNALKIHSIGVTAGQLRMLDRDFMQRFFDIFTKGTIAQGAQLELSVIPIRYQCGACGAVYEMTPKEWLAMDADRAACVRCGSADITLLSGGEYYISDIVADIENEEALFDGGAEETGLREPD